MPSSYLNHTRSLEALDTLIEKDRVAAALITKVQFEAKVINCIAHIDKTCEISLARIVSESETAAVRITANAEVATARLGARFEIIQSEIEKLSLTGIAQEELEITVAMLVESSRQNTIELAAESKQSVKELEGDTADAISRIKKHAAESIAEIKVMKAGVIKQNSETAKIAHQKLLFSKTQNRTEDETEQEGIDAAELVLSAVGVSKTEVESQSDKAIARIQISVEDAHQRIKFICDSAIKKIEVMMKGAIDKLEFTINERLARLG